MNHAASDAAGGEAGMKGYPGMKRSNFKQVNHNLPIDNPSDDEVEGAVLRLKNAFTCPICGTPKTHHRLHGYRCSVNPEHDEMARNMNEQELADARAKWQDLK